MSRSRKHVTQEALQDEVRPPGDRQSIVRALGSRGGNLVQVELPSGQSTLCLLPAKFQKKLWVKRGGYLIIETGDQHDGAVTGTIVRILYKDDIKVLKKDFNVWPKEFEDALKLDMEQGQQKSLPASEQADSSEEESDSDLPPLVANTNRAVVEYDLPSDDSEEEGSR